MKITNFLTLPLLLVGASAASVPARRAGLTSGYSWTVSNYTQGCSLGGCVYNFILATHRNSTEPSFNTTCNGTNVATNFQVCGNPGVSTKEVNGAQSTTLLVEHVYYVGGTRYNISGNHTIHEPNPPSTFQVPELEISAVG